MILQLKEIKKYFGSNEILSDVSARLVAGDRVAIIGENGAGKTTLLKIITGEYSSDDGELMFASGCNIGYLSQHNDFEPGSSVFTEMMTVYAPAQAALLRMRELETLLISSPDCDRLHTEHDEAERIVLASDFYNSETTINKLLYGFGFTKEMFERPTSVLSGGEATRLRLAKLLLKEPDLLLLDEPTNHLDFATLAFFEQELLNFKGAVISVTHDRAFIRNVCTAVWELERGKIQTYNGSLDNYFEQKRQSIERQQKLHDADVKTAKKLEEYIARNKVRASTAKMAKSREKQLKKLEITDKPHLVSNRFNFTFDVCSEPYKDILSCQNLTVKGGEKLLLQGVDFEVKKEEKIIIAGENGAGKSTLLNVLTGSLFPQEGSVRLGIGAEPSVFKQHRELRHGNVIDVIRAQRPKFTEQQARDLLAKFLFRGDEVFANCATLSGGESARLRLAEMTLERANFLILDEPTNHIDLFTRESLTRALCGYEGTLLVVTHDRYLMEQLDSPILYIHDKTITKFDNYEKLYEWLGITAVIEKPKFQQTEPQEQTVKGKAADRKKRADYRERLRITEQTIARCEQEISDYQKLLEYPEICSDHVKLTEITETLTDLHRELDEAVSEWEILLTQDAE